MNAQGNGPNQTGLAPRCSLWERELTRAQPPWGASPRRAWGARGRVPPPARCPRDVLLGCFVRTGDSRLWGEVSLLLSLHRHGSGQAADTLGVRCWLSLLGAAPCAAWLEETIHGDPSPLQGAPGTLHGGVGLSADEQCCMATVTETATFWVTNSSPGCHHHHHREILLLLSPRNPHDGLCHAGAPRYYLLNGDYM